MPPRPPVKQIPRALWLAVCEAGGWACYLCGRPVVQVAVNLDFQATVDHVRPRGLPGSDDPANLRCCCRRCNTEKSFKSAWRCISYRAFVDLIEARIPLPLEPLRPLTEAEISTLWRYYMFDGDEEVEWWLHEKPHPLIDGWLEELLYQP
jgi:hypothetical protein